jgi:hypothetical protein
MHKILQALIDTIQLAAGATELGSAAHSPANNGQGMRPHTDAKQLSNRDLPAAQAGRAEPQPFAGEPTLRTSADKSRI